jgi:hypothetical protein
MKRVQGQVPAEGLGVPPNSLVPPQDRRSASGGVGAQGFESEFLDTLPGIGASAFS